MLYRRARQCLTAGTRGQRVDDGWNGEHSPFTGKLLGFHGKLPWSYNLIHIATAALALFAGFAAERAYSRY